MLLVRQKSLITVTLKLLGNNCWTFNKFSVARGLQITSNKQKNSISLSLIMADQGVSSAADGVTSSATAKVDSGTNNSPGFDRDKCIFCRIIDGKDKDSAAKILYQDDEIVVFPDIRPASKNHLLVVTKEHIKDAKSLTTSQIELLDRLVQTGTKVLTDNLMKEGETVDETQLLSKTLMGFHWPPFHTISHLHLHVISPSDQIGFIGRIIFRPNSYWFVQPGWVKERLEKLRDAASTKS